MKTGDSWSWGVVARNLANGRFAECRFDPHRRIRLGKAAEFDELLLGQQCAHLLFFHLDCFLLVTALALLFRLLLISAAAASAGAPSVRAAVGGDPGSCRCGPSRALANASSVLSRAANAVH
jgi:hypothetical protein